MKKTVKQPDAPPSNATLPDDEKQAILRAVLALLPDPKSSTSVAENSIALRRLSDDIQAGKEVTQAEVGAALASTYEAYSVKLKETAEHSEVDEGALQAASAGYALLADGSRHGDFLELAEGLKAVKDAVDALSPGKPRAAKPKAAGKPTAKKK